MFPLYSIPTIAINCSSLFTIQEILYLLTIFFRCLLIYFAASDFSTGIGVSASFRCMFCDLMKQFFPSFSTINSGGKTCINANVYTLFSIWCIFDNTKKERDFNDSAKTDCELQRDKRKSKSTAKRDWQNKIDCWRASAERYRKEAMQQTSQCQEWKAKSNQKANERERLTTKNWVMKDCLSTSIKCRNSQEMDEWQTRDKIRKQEDKWTAKTISRLKLSLCDVPIASSISTIYPSWWNNESVFQFFVEIFMKCFKGHGNWFVFKMVLKWPNVLNNLAGINA